MSNFKRANWHSGLTYQQTCENCKTIVKYTDYSLDYRPWYADGFVYCPTCEKPLRHNEKYAIDAPAVPKTTVLNTDFGTALFCVKCGYKFTGSENFCPNCGQKRE